MAVETARSVEDLRALYGDLHRFGQELRECSLRFRQMVRGGAFAEHGHSYAYEPDDPKDVLNRSIDITRRFEFLIAVTGAFSSGKSSLVNLLLAQPDLLPAAVIPMTAVCTVVRHGERPRLELRYAPFRECFDRVRECIGRPFAQPFTGPEHLAEAAQRPDAFVTGTEAQQSLQRFADVLRRYDEITAHHPGFDARAPYVAGGGVVPAHGGARYYSPTPKEHRDYLAAGGDPHRWVTREWLALLRDVTLRVPSPILENDIVFLDLPGLNCREDYHRRAIREYCNLADCILVAAFQPGNQADADVIADFKRLSANYRDKIFFVFNKVDQFAQEPNELVRAVDYLARDTIGSDFPRDRFFLTSAQLARGCAAGDPASARDLDRLRAALTPVAASLPGLDDWVRHVTDPDDPGGVEHLRANIWTFLVDDAYRTKVSEIVGNYRGVLDALVQAAGPAFGQGARIGASDLMRRSVLDYFHWVDKLHRNAIHRFRYEYLRGHEQERDSALREDLHVALDEIHVRVQDAIRAYFDRPILSAPLREEPVGEFDLLLVADTASENLRRELQDLVIGALNDRITATFRSFVRQPGLQEHLQNLFRAAPECLRRLETLAGRLEQTLLHSLKCIVRNGFFYMPRGRSLKRLERTVSQAHMKDLLVEVFCDFYPSWIYENIYAEIIDRLWLSLYLDAEDFEGELQGFFRANESVVTGAHVAERIKVPDEVAAGASDLLRSIRMCEEIEELARRSETLHDRAISIGVTS